MPAAIPAVATIVAAAFELEWWAQVLIYMVASIGSSALMKSEDDAIRPESPSGIKVMANTRDSREVMRVPYGEVQIGGNDVYIGYTGADHSTLWVVQVLGEGECEGIAQVDGEDQVFIGEEHISTVKYDDEGSSWRYSDYITYYFHAGTNDQVVDPYLHAALPEWTDPMVNTCYIVWKLVWCRELFSSLPLRTVVLKGRKLYDFRDGTTAYSNNPVLEEYDYFTHSRYGMNQLASRVDIDSWTAAANYCDTKGWTCNMVLADRSKARDILDKFELHFRGYKRWYNGKTYMGYADLNYEASCMNLTDSHLARDAEGKATLTVTQPSLFQRPDGLVVTYVDPDKNYVNDSLQIGEDHGVIQELNLTGCTDRQQAADLGVYNLERRQLSRSISGVFRDDAIQLEPHDIVTLTVDAPGFVGVNTIVDQLMRVQEAVINPSGLVELSLIYESILLYNDDYDVSEDEIYTCNLPDPTDPPPQVANVSFSEELYTIKDRTYVRVKVSWEDPTYYPFIDRVEMWVSDDGVTYTHYSTASNSSFFEPAEVGETWYFKLVPISIWGVKLSSDSAAVHSHIVVGKTDVPSNVINFHALVMGDMLHFAWDRAVDTDIVGYEVRWGTSWAESLFVFLTDATSKTLVGVKPSSTLTAGVHKFYIAAKDAMGNYSDTPSWAQVEVFLPPNYTEQHAPGWDHDFTTGTFNNTERYNHPSHGWVLRVSSGASETWNSYTGGDDTLAWDDQSIPEGMTWEDMSSIRSGYWESPEIDLTANDLLRFWTAFEWAIDSVVGTSWETLFGGDTEWSWANILSAGQSWRNAFEFYPSASLYMVLYYKKDGESTWYTAKHFEILSAEVNARYIKYRIYLINRNSQSAIYVKASCGLRSYYWS